MSDKPGRGGRRAGAGRPPKGETPMSSKVSAMLTPEDAAYLKRVGGTISEGLRIVIEAHRKQADK
jgi:hypothetical protein